MRIRTKKKKKKKHTARDKRGRPRNYGRVYKESREISSATHTRGRIGVTNNDTKAGEESRKGKKEGKPRSIEELKTRR